ncbi:polyprenyl synthetase family protein [Microbacterium suaedae]|uniref:polyprenyl synthetase family protein n=1 Tax=Microbacterium suaedae TaxID=2067813 RepID=UPI000DA22EE0|nr:polyprenyl synthetase family protein [Microbacterium suaedae]
MSPAHAIISAISERLEGFTRARRREVELDEVFAGAPHGDPAALLLLEHAEQALAGGKRLRAQFAFWGWRAATRTPGAPPAHVLDLGASLEVFQAAALVHDDIVDNSDTRRGRPASWRALETAHDERGWSGSGEAFGRSGAILLGDLLLGWSDDLLERALAALDDARHADAARAVYARMRRDVILGQFLDIAEESAWPTLPDEAHADRALRIAVLKSARYSVQQPLLIGAELGGAEAHTRKSLTDIGPPLGLAFQLRDDVLGVFGDPVVTGKPSGDDLREGKRTLLVAYAREGMDGSERKRFDSRLGADDLSDGEIAHLQDIVRASGALARVEELISRQRGVAERALERADLDETTSAELGALLEAATARTS